VDLAYIGILRWIENCVSRIGRCDGRTADIKSYNDMVAWLGDRHGVLNISSPARGVEEGGHKSNHIG
jgi:hypothetical protein